jgi:hypothetical protein
MSQVAPVSPPPRSHDLLLGVVLAFVAALSVVYFLNHLSYATDQDPWGVLFASRQYTQHGPLWHDPVVRTLWQLEQEGASFPKGLQFTGGYQWYCHGASGFFLPWTYAWIDASVDCLFGLGAAFWIPLVCTLALWVFLALTGRNLGSPLLGVCLLVAAARWLPMEPNNDALPFLFLPHREPLVLALFFGAVFLITSRLPGRFVLAGAGIGLAFAVREQFGVVVPVAALAALILSGEAWRSPTRWRDAGKRGLQWGLGFGIGMAPWLAQTWVCDASARALWAGTSVSLESVAVMLQRHEVNSGVHWSPHLLPFYAGLLNREMGVIGWILFAWGTLTLVRRRQWGMLLMCGGGGGAMLLLHGFWHETSYRYALSIMMPLYPCLGVGLWAASNVAARALAFCLPCRASPQAALLVVAALCVGALAAPTRLMLTAASGSTPLTRTEALRFRAAVAAAAGAGERVVLVNIDRHRTLFCSAAYWADGYVFSPSAIGEAAPRVVDRLLSARIPVLLLTDAADPAASRDTEAMWVAQSWPLTARGMVWLGARYTLWQLQPRARAPDIPAQFRDTTSSKR